MNEIEEIIKIAKKYSVPISININCPLLGTSSKNCSVICDENENKVILLKDNIKQNQTTPHFDIKKETDLTLVDHSYSYPKTNTMNNEPLLTFQKETIKKYCKILIASTQWAGYGGAATNAYNLIKFLRNKGYSCAGLFHESSGNFDPDKIGGIWNLQRINDKPNYVEISKKVRKEIVMYLRGEPIICFSKNYISPLECKLLFPSSIIVYLVSGSSHATDFANQKISIQKFLATDTTGGSTTDLNINKKEIKTMEVVDYIVPNSLISYRVAKKIYPQFSNKILEYYDTSYASVKQWKSGENNSNRNYDIIFITSRCDRTVKGGDVIQQIFSDPRLKDYSKLIIGDKSDNHFNNSGIENVILKSGVSNNEVLEYLSRSKLLIAPSYYDASPNCPREALSCGCYVLINKNTGYSEFLDEHFVCEDNYDIDEWVNKTQYLLQNYSKLKLPDQDYTSFFDKFSDLIYRVSCHKFWNHFNVLDEITALQEILNNKKSIVRFTDSELRICLGRDGKKQKHSQDLEMKLKEILTSFNCKNLLIGIPPIYGNQLTKLKDVEKWIKHNERYIPLLDSTKIYYSSFITRYDWLIDSSNMYVKFMELFKQIWSEKNVVFVNYSPNIPKMLSNCKSVHLVKCSNENAYTDKDFLISEIRKVNCDLVLLSCGPTATVIVYELTKTGIWSIDIGSFR